MLSAWPLDARIVRTYPALMMTDQARFFGSITAIEGYVGIACLTVRPDRLHLIYAPGFPPFNFGRESEVAVVLSARQAASSLRQPPDLEKIRQRRRGALKISDPKSDHRRGWQAGLGIKFWSLNRPAVIAGLEHLGWTVQDRSESLG